MLDIPNQKTKAIADIKDIEETIQKLQGGKFTWGGLLKSDAEKKQSIVQKELVKADLQQDVINYDTIRKILIIYLSQIAIPTY